MQEFFLANFSVFSTIRQTERSRYFVQRSDKNEPFLFEEIEAAPADLDATTRDDALFLQKKQGPFNFFQLPFFRRRTFFLFVGVCAGVLLQWIFTSELFYVPLEVAQSRSLFLEAKASYEQQQAYWDMKLHQFLSSVSDRPERAVNGTALQNLQGSAPELWIAYLVNQLGYSLDRLEKISLLPRDRSSDAITLMVSKYENGIWPLRIMLSLEIEIKISGRRLSADVVRIRRGCRDVALGLSWAYFGAELEPLRKLELLPGTRTTVSM